MGKTKKVIGKDELKKRITIYLVIVGILLSFLGGYYLFTTLDFTSNAINITKENFNIWYLLILWVILSEIMYIYITFTESELRQYQRTNWKGLKVIGYIISMLSIIGATAIIGLIKGLIEKLTLSILLLIGKYILYGAIILFGIYVLCIINRKIYNYIADNFFK